MSQTVSKSILHKCYRGGYSVYADESENGRLLGRVYKSESRVPVYADGARYAVGFRVIEGWTARNYDSRVVTELVKTRTQAVEALERWAEREGIV